LNAVKALALLADSAKREIAKKEVMIEHGLEP
jgi:hypothetical protein